jgi:iron only hydrogenase large subunit-like protein
MLCYNILEEAGMALRFRRQATASERARRESVIRLMAQVRGLLSGLEGAVVSVSDHDCAGLGCCATSQTTILVLRPDQPTRVFKIDKPVAAVTQLDVIAAIAPLLGNGPVPCATADG